MTIPFICLLIAALIPSLLAYSGGYFKFKQFGSLDNRHPREQAAKLEGIGSRAVAAQSNAWEALAVFTAGVMVNHARGGDPETSALLAELFVVARFAHAGFYLADINVARSLSYLVGWVCSLALFFV